MLPSDRPWPIPDRPWIMAQTWHDLLFAHWPVPPDILRARIPPGLTLDTYEGQAWVGVVPFRMTGVRLRGLPALPPVGAFEELNVRTYVVRGDRPGVYFFSLDAASRVAVTLARRWFHLPYHQARMSLGRADGWVHYRSDRIGVGGGARFVGRYRPTGDVNPAAPGTLAHWLTARYCLYAVGSNGHLYRAEIDHRPWPLQPAEAEIEVNTMAAAANVALPTAPPLLHFARRLDVVVWPLTAIRSEAHA